MSRKFAGFRMQIKWALFIEQWEVYQNHLRRQFRFFARVRSPRCTSPSIIWVYLSVLGAPAQVSERAALVNKMLYLLLRCFHGQFNACLVSRAFSCSARVHLLRRGIWRATVCSTAERIWLPFLLQTITMISFEFVGCNSAYEETAGKATVFCEDACLNGVVRSTL